MPRLSYFDIMEAVEWTIDLTLTISHSRRLDDFGLSSSLSMADLDILLPAVPNIRVLHVREAEFSIQALQKIPRGMFLSNTMLEPIFVFIVPTLEVLGLHLDTIEQRFDILKYGDMSLRLLWGYNRDDPAPAMRRLI